MRLAMSMAKGADGATMVSKRRRGQTRARGRHTEVEHKGRGGDLLDGKGRLGLHGADLLRGLLRGRDYTESTSANVALGLLPNRYCDTAR